MDAEDFAWLVTRPADEVIDRDHPDYSYWADTLAWEDSLASGEPINEPPPLPQQPQQPQVPAFAFTVSVEVAAASLGVSVDFFDKHVRPDLRIISKGRRVMVPARELERWVEENAAFALRGSL